MKRSIVGLIPARGGSKGIPGKNLAPCAGRPLIKWTIDASMASQRLDSVFLSTDDPAIANVGKDAGMQVPFLRPAALALDQSSSLDVILHFVDWLDRNCFSVDAVALLQPTSPLRESRHIDEACQLFESGDWDSVVSVVQVEHRHLPRKLMRLGDCGLAPLETNVVDISPRQDADPLYARNGPAILVTAVPVLRQGSLYGKRIGAYVMNKSESVDIDDFEDMWIADSLLRARDARREVCR